MEGVDVTFRHIPFGLLGEKEENVKDRNPLCNSWPSHRKEMPGNLTIFPVP
jgi:hypothetical protein